MASSAKPDEMVQKRIEEIAAEQKITPAELASLGEESRGRLLSTPANTHGSPQAAITAALLNTQLAVTALEQAGRTLFPQGRNLYFDKDLEGIAFMVVTPPEHQEVTDNFDPSKKVSHVFFTAWLLDEGHIETSGYDASGVPIVTGYNGPEPRRVDVELAGGYVQNTFFELPRELVMGRVWTMGYDEKTLMKKGPRAGEPARMLRFWKPATIEQQGTF